MRKMNLRQHQLADLAKCCVENMIERMIDDGEDEIVRFIYSQLGNDADVLIDIE